MDNKNLNNENKEEAIKVLVVCIIGAIAILSIPKIMTYFN